MITTDCNSKLHENTTPIVWFLLTTPSQCLIFKYMHVQRWLLVPQNKASYSLMPICCAVIFIPTACPSCSYSYFHIHMIALS